VLAGGIAATGALLALPAHASAALHEAAFTVLVGVAVALILLAAVHRPAERRIWLVLGVAISANAACEATGGWSHVVTGPVLGAVSVGTGLMVIPLAVAAVTTMLRMRVGRLPAVAVLDGLSGAFVMQTLIALAILGPVEHALASRGLVDSATLLYPLADLVVVGILAAAAAERGWWLDTWAWLLAGLVAITVGDAAQVAQVAGTGFDVRGATNVAWLAGTWLLAAGAWAPPPRRADDRVTRAWVPVAFSALAFALVLLTAIAPGRSPLALAMAACALATVIVRFALTLRANAQMLAHARREAATDALTGLANRRRLTLDLEAELARTDRPGGGALALYDLNGFKDYNDTYGHPAGDALLVALSEKLRAAVAGSGIAYRMGGDEFCVLVTGTADDPAAVAARAAAALDMGMQGFQVDASHGLVLLPGEAATASDALRLADVRMYQDKERRRMGPRRQATRALMGALAERDAGLHEHLQDVQGLAATVAASLGLDPVEVERVRLGALLHDVGKIAIPDSILHKPGPLTEAEWVLMRRHTLVGGRILERAPALADVAALVRASHERLDGTGYPAGLAGEAIPIGARIIAVCDAYDAMVAERAYRAPMSRDAAFAELRACAGTQFDPQVVELFVAAVEARDAAPAADAARAAA
jgi:two-component system cell cycle response regulator